MAAHVRVRSLWVAMALGAAACGSTTQSVTGPSGTKCPVSVAASASTFNASGGTGGVDVETARECQWSASSRDAWIEVNGGSQGQGDGRVEFTVRPNGDPAARRGTIVVNDQEVGIEQAAATCRFTVSPTSHSVPPGGERRTVDVSASSPLCPWTARADVEWIAIVDGTSGTGNGRVVFDVRATSGPRRDGWITVAGHRVTVQQGGGCSYELTSTETNVGAGGGQGTVGLTTTEECSWTATSGESWVRITSSASGSGPATIRFEVDPNSGPARSATLTIAGIEHRVAQAGACTYTIDSPSQSVHAAGGTGSIDVTAGDGCAWSALSSQSWLQITAPPNGAGSGNGRVTYSVDPNAGPARQGTIFVAGQTFVVQQADGCTISLSPPGQAFDAAGGSGTFNVTAAAGCSWTAASNADWIKVGSPSEGSGNGAVEFQVDANAGPARSGTIAIGTQVFTVTQTGSGGR